MSQPVDSILVLLLALFLACCVGLFSACCVGLVRSVRAMGREQLRLLGWLIRALLALPFVYMQSFCGTVNARLAGVTVICQYGIAHTPLNGYMVKSAVDQYPQSCGVSMDRAWEVLIWHVQSANAQRLNAIATAEKSGNEG